MNPFKGLGALIGSFWRFAKGTGYVPNRGVRVLYIFLTLIFMTVALVLLGLGVELDEADRWLDRHGGAISLIADWLWRGACGVVLLFCVIIVVISLIDWGKRIYGGGTELGLPPDEPPPPRASGCAFLVALVIGYFAWTGMTMTE
jgi:hypothetical protein